MSPITVLLFTLGAFLHEAAAQCQCTCASSPPTTIRTTARPTAPSTPSTAPSRPVTSSPTNGDFCAPQASPMSWPNAASWPLRNETISEPSGLSDTQLDTANSGVSDYIVRKHNCLRSITPASNMLRMEWNSEAAAQAQQWANNCQFAHNPASQRQTSQFGCGQNIAMGTGMRLSWNRVVNMWYNEVKDYVYGQQNTVAVTGHYTQIVWAKTYQIGCGYRNCGNMFFYVCNYCPAGNMGGMNPYNQGPSCGACPSSCAGGKLCTNTCGFSNVYSNCDQLQASSNICTNPSLADFASKCPATCKCQGKIY